MLQFLFDTDHLTFFEQGHAPLGGHLAKHGTTAIGISIVTVEESLRGRLAHLARAPDGPARISRYGYLRGTIQVFCDLAIVPYDQAAEDQFQQLVGLRLRVGTRDLKIAAIALANNLTLLSRNKRDFGQVPGLRLDDWSV
jgi:tRNA(fMet)-specific endonuclease VapC